MMNIYRNYKMLYWMDGLKKKVMFFIICDFIGFLEMSYLLWMDFFIS